MDSLWIIFYGFVKATYAQLNSMLNLFQGSDQVELRTNTNYTNYTNCTNYTNYTNHTMYGCINRAKLNSLSYLAIQMENLL